MDYLKAVRNLVGNSISNHLLGFPVFLNKISVGMWLLDPFKEMNDGGTSDFRDPITDPDSHNGFRYNPADGNWYSSPPAPDVGQYSWEGPADSSQQGELNNFRNWALAYNEFREEKLRREAQAKADAISRRRSKGSETFSFLNH